MSQDLVSRTFADVVAQMRRGNLADELDRKLRALVLQVQDTEKAGAITLTIK